MSFFFGHMLNILSAQKLSMPVYIQDQNSVANIMGASQSLRLMKSDRDTFTRFTILAFELLFPSCLAALARLQTLNFCLLLLDVDVEHSIPTPLCFDLLSCRLPVTTVRAFALANENGSVVAVRKALSTVLMVYVLRSLLSGSNMVAR
jgi:hypothetical protein